MREKLRNPLLSLCMVSALASFAWAGAADNDVVLTLVPVGGSNATGGQMVTIEAFVTPNVQKRFEGGQWDAPCIVLPKPGGTGQLTATGNVTGTGGSSGGIGYLFNANGLAPFAPATCITATTPGVGKPTVVVTAGTTRFLGGVIYTVSDCAAGAFNIGFECTDQPGGCDSDPEGTNTTRFREDEPPGPGQGLLLSIQSFGTATITVPTGSCCNGTSCLCDDVNSFCCQNLGAVGRDPACANGSSWVPGGVCGTPGDCQCTSDNDCPDSFCSPRHCDVASGLCVDDPTPVCDDGNQCTDDSCPPGAGACVFTNDDTNLCTNPDPEGHADCDDPDTCSAGVCLENNAAAGTSCNGGNDQGECDNPDSCDGAGNCQNNNKVGACTDDGNQCTDDACSGGDCVHTNDNSNPCSDGLACTTGDACNAGACGGTAVNCDDGDQCTGDSCVEPGGCVNDNVADNPCLSDAECGAVVPGAVCVNGFCACNPCIGHPNGDACDDGDPCTQDECYDEDCLSKPICDDDGDLCTNAVCERVACCLNGTGGPGGPSCGVTGQGQTGHCGGPSGALCTNDLDCTICEHVAKEDCDDVPQIDLVVDDDDVKNNCFDEGSTISVDVTLSDTTFCVAGGQFRVTYDNTCMDFVSASAGDAPWTQLIFVQANEAAGVVFVAVGVPVPPLGPKCDDAGVMARLNFTKIGKCNECELCLSDANPVHTRLTTDKGDELEPVNKCSKTIRDDRATDMNCPHQNDAGGIAVNSECDKAGAHLSWPPVTGKDQCDGEFPLNCTCEHIPILQCRLGSSNKVGEVCQDPLREGDECVLTVAGQEVKGTCQPKNAPDDDCESKINTGGFFEQGTYRFDCSEPKSPDHVCTNNNNCSWTVKVSDHQSLDVTVQLSPVVLNNEFNRCICFEGFSSCSPEVSEETCVDMVFGGGGVFAGQSTDSVKIKKGKYHCLTARDRQHSLRSTHYLTCDGVAYHAQFRTDPFFGGNWLIQGNLNRDAVIDILDFGVFIGQLNQNPNPKLDKFCEDNFGQGYTHADFNGDGNVDVSDFTFIQINFLEDDKNSCCPGDGAASTPVVGLTEISVKDLRRMGLGDLAIADLNGDGLVSTDDMAAYLAGARPKEAGKGERGGNGRLGAARR